MLAGVEDEDRVGVTKARHDPRQRIGAAGVDGLRDEADDVGRAAGIRETDVPRASAELALERAGRLEGESTLADAGRPGQRHEAVFPQELDHLAELRLAVDERGRRSGHVAARPWCKGDGRDRRVVRQDRLLKAPQLRTRLQCQLVHEDAPRLLENVECVRLAAAAVERQHQLPP